MKQWLLDRLPVEIRRRPDPDLGLYERVYGREAVARRAFVNLGAGGFRHPAWRNVDHTNGWYDGDAHPMDVDLDFFEHTPLPFADGELELAYCSHVIEHLDDETDRYLLAEARRVLAPGGILRIVAPDARVSLDAYHRGDLLFFEREMNHAAECSLEQHLLITFASSLAEPAADGNATKLSDVDVRSMLAELGDEGALAKWASMCSTDHQRSHPGQHLNWFDVGRVVAFCEAAGFKTGRRSAYGQSASPVMRDTRWFDTSHPGVCLYVEAEA